MNIMHLRRLVTITTVAMFSITTLADVSAEESRLLLAELGITPEIMAILGMNSVQATSAFNRIDDNESMLTALRSVQDQHRSAMTGLQQARKSVRAAETEDDAQIIQVQIDQYETDLAAYAINIENLQDQLRAAILPPSVDPITVELLCEPQGLFAALPAEYRIADLDETDFATLFSAISAEQKAINNGEAIPNDAQLTLSQYRNIPAVQTARSNLFYNLDAIKNVYYH